MKKEMFLSILLIFSNLSLCSTSEINTVIINEHISIGMNFNEFKEIYTNADIYSNPQWSTHTEIYNIEGNWTYDFNANNLEWYIFNSYENNINQENFDKYFIATEKIVKYFNEKFGEPIFYEEENNEFIDPFIEHHWGYSVIKGVWEINDEKFKVEFYFMGAKGEYNFLLSIECHDANYEYY